MLRSNRQAQRTIGWAEHLVIVSPLWHSTMPALDLQAAKTFLVIRPWVPPTTKSCRIHCVGIDLDIWRMIGVNYA